MSSRTPVVGLAAAAALLALPATALAKDGDVRERGTCSGSASATLKLSPDDGRIETEVEVDQNRNGVRWIVSIRRNGRVAATARATTRAPERLLRGPPPPARRRGRRPHHRAGAQRDGPGLHRSGHAGLTRLPPGYAHPSIASGEHE